MLGDQVVPSGVRMETTWDSPWSLHDPMLAMAQVDPSDFPMIEVLNIPDSLPFDRDTVNSIRDLFVGGETAQAKSQ
jgi:hypothetical protein